MAGAVVGDWGVRNGAKEHARTAWQAWMRTAADGSLMTIGNAAVTCPTVAASLIVAAAAGYNATDWLTCARER